MKVLVLDSETSGLPLFSQRSDHPDQPHVVQYTAVMFDDETGEEEEYVDLIIRQEWPVEPKAFAVHKITPEHSLEVGVPEHHAVQYFEAMIDIADRVVGFSLPFDLRIMRIAMLRTGRARGYCDLIHERAKTKSFDIMHKCTPLCRIPPTEKMMATGRKIWKTPSLVEAVKALFGREMGDAHDSRGDVLETKNIYLELKRRGLA